MSADIKDDLQPYDDINVTPMLDLAYVLLVVFIILTTASVQGVRVESPVTQAANNLARPQTKAITITADGAVYLDAYPVTMEQLATSLAQMKAANPNLPVRSVTDAFIYSGPNADTPVPPGPEVKQDLPYQGELERRRALIRKAVR